MIPHIYEECNVTYMKLKLNTIVYFLIDYVYP